MSSTPGPSRWPAARSEFRGPNNSFGGAIGGVGTFVLGGGSANTFNSGLAMSVSNLDIYDNGTALTLLGNETYANTFNQGFGTSINLNGHNLTLSGAASFFNSNFGTPTVNGSGTLATLGATTINLFVLGGTVNWSNTGGVSEISTLQIGDSGIGRRDFHQPGGGNLQYRQRLLG